MIGIVPGTDSTYNVQSTFEDTANFKEGDLYIDNRDNRLYMYSSKLTRPCIHSGFFPVYNGKQRFVTKYANKKYYPQDIILSDLSVMINKVNDNIVKNVSSLQKHCSDNEKLVPVIGESDNSFTQCIKAILIQKQFTLTDLSEMSGLDDKIIKSYYTVLNKISFMRLDRFYIWMKTIFHMSFKVKVWDNDNNKVISYDDNTGKYETGIISYDDIINSDDDFLKKIIHILMRMKSITKQQLNNGEEQDYTINNLLILLNTKNKPFSAQLFSRFMGMIKYSYSIEIYEGRENIFTYQE